MGCLSLAFVLQEWYVKLFGSDSEAAGLVQFGVEFQNGGNRFLIKPSLSFHFLRFFGRRKNRGQRCLRRNFKGRGEKHPAVEKSGSVGISCLLSYLAEAVLRVSI